MTLIFIFSVGILNIFSWAPVICQSFSLKYLSDLLPHSNRVVFSWWTHSEQPSCMVDAGLELDVFVVDVFS